MKKKKIEQHIINLPEMEYSELVEFINKKLLQENAELKAEVLKLRSLLSDKKESKIRKTEEEKLKKEIIKHEKEKKEIEKLNQIKVVFKDVKYPVFYLRSMKAFFKLKGFVLREFEDGYIGVFPLLTDGKREFIFKKPTQSFLDFFKDTKSLVTQIRSGSVITNFDLTDDKEPLFIPPKDEVIAEDENGEKVKIIRLDEMERAKYEKEISEWKEAYNKLAYRLEELEKIKVKQERKLAEQEIALQSAIAERDEWASTVSQLVEKQVAGHQAIASAIAGIQDIKTEQILTERLNMILNRVVKNLRNKIGEVLSKGEREIDEERIRDIIQNAIASIKSEIISIKKAGGE